MSRRSVECRLAGACSEEPRSKSLTTRWRPGQRRRPHPSTGCGFLVRKPHCIRDEYSCADVRNSTYRGSDSSHPAKEVLMPTFHITVRGADREAMADLVRVHDV